MLLTVAATLEALGIRYALTGSMASNIWGHPRFTHDADIVMSPGEVTPDQFVAAFEKKFYVSRDAFAEAFRRKSMANLIHLATAAKVDIWVAARNSFSRTCLERRRKVKVQGGGIFVFSPDDLVLAKLLWYKRTRSERQIDDAAGILQVSAATIDSDYLQKMADELGVEEHLETVRRKLEGG